MLIVLYGTSCIGKTTLIKYLIDNHQWIPISCYLTRPLRDSDIARITVTNKEFNAKDGAGYFSFVNQQYNVMYGTPEDELRIAANDLNNKYILDFMLKNSWQLENINHTRVIMLPETEEFLKSRISLANRQERLSEILIDFQENYNLEKVFLCEQKGFKILIVRNNSIESIFREFTELLERDHLLVKLFQ